MKIKRIVIYNKSFKKHIDAKNRCTCDDVCARFHSYIIIGRVDTQIYTYAMIFTVRCHRYSNY